MKTINFKKAVTVLGYTVVRVCRGYNYRTIIAKDNTGQFYYFHIEDLRDAHPHLYYRTIVSEHDLNGGTNMFDMEDKLARMGYRVVEPRRASSDYNHM